MENNKCIALIRTSTEKQEIEAQKKEIVEYAQTFGYTPNNIIIIGDRGASAIKLNDLYLENMGKVEELIKTDKSIDSVFAWAIDRIGRDEVVLFSFKRMLIDNGINLRIKEPTLQLLNDDGSVNGGVELAFSLFATLAQQEMKNKVVRFKRAKKDNKSKGKYIGGSIKYGYTTDENGYIVVNEIEAKIIRLAFEWYANEDELSVRGIVDRFEELGYTLAPNKIYKFLRDKTYYGGNMEFPHPPIITKELFDGVRSKAKEKDVNASKSKQYYFGSKLLKCSVCGRFLSSYRNNGHYACSHYYNEPKNDRSCSNSMTVSMNASDTILYILAKEHYSIISVKEYKNTIQRLKCENEALNERIKVLDRKIGGEGNDMERIKTLYKKGLISNEEELDKEISEVKNKYKSLKDDRLRLSNQIENNIRIIDDFESGKNGNIDVGAMFRKAYESKELLSYKECYDFIHKMIKECTVTSGYDGEDFIRIYDITYTDGTIEKVCYYPYISKWQSKYFGRWSEEDKCWIMEDYADEFLKRV